MNTLTIFITTLITLKSEEVGPVSYKSCDRIYACTYLLTGRWSNFERGSSSSMVIAENGL